MDLQAAVAAVVMDEAHLPEPIHEVANLAAVVDHYDATLKLKLSAAQKKDLVEYLKSI